MSSRKTPRTSSHNVRFPRSVLAVSVSMVLAAQAQANPVGPSVAHGTASFSGRGSGSLDVTNSPGTIINWQGFSIGPDEVTRFIQQHSASAVLNRVTGGNPSEILGSLLSNGRVFLINQNGIVFGEHAVVDTAGFVASTLNMTDADFIAGRLHFSGGEGKLENRGYIRVRDGGDVMLIAPDIANAGIVRADDGSILLAAGRDVVIESLDYEHVRFRVQAPQDRVLNLGRIITTNGVAALFAGTLEHRGVVEANRISRGANGVIRLEASDSATIAGTLEARGRGATGGDITVTGPSVTARGARIDASGDAGGGRVRVGGDYQGKGALARADRTILDAATEIRADAVKRGDGGEIIVWSDVETRTDARLSARGGPGGGDGGMVETSSKGVLAFGRAAEVSAPAGRGGTWLLDPEDITIGGDEAASISETLNTGGNVSVKTSDSGDGEGNITVASAIHKTEGGDAALSMEAHNRIDVNAPITSTAGKLDVSLTAGSAVHVNARVATNGGQFSQVVTEMAVEMPEPGDDEAAQTGEGVLKPEEELAQGVGDGNGPVESNALDDDIENAAPEGADTGENLASSGPAVEDDSVALVEDAGAGVQNEVESLTVSDDAFKESLQVLVDDEIDTAGGDIYVDAGRAGTAGIYGRLDASNETGQGGDVTVLGRNVGLFEEAEIDASGDTGGGTVLVGGGQQGQDPDVPNSEAVYVGGNASIQADAGSEGDGGRVIVFAENSAKVYGRLSARGGTLSGDGGFVETSGLEHFVVRSTPDVGAPGGNAGTWLIDPSNIRIDIVNTTSDIEQSPGTNGVDTVFNSDNATDSTILIDDIFTAMLNGATVRVETQCRDESSCVGPEGNITFGSPFTPDIDFDRAGPYDGNGGTLILHAANDIYFQSGLRDSDTQTEDILNLHVITDSNDTTYFQGVGVTVDNFTAESKVVVTDETSDGYGGNGSLRVRGNADFQDALQVSSTYGGGYTASVTIEGDATFRGDVEVSKLAYGGAAILRTNTSFASEGTTWFQQRLDVLAPEGGEGTASVYVNDGNGRFDGDVRIEGSAPDLYDYNALLSITNDGDADSVDASFNADVQLEEYAMLRLEGSEYGGSAIGEFNETFHWNGGWLEETQYIGSFYVRPGAVATIDGGEGGRLYMQNARLVNQGTVQFLDGVVYGGAASQPVIFDTSVIENEGVWNVNLPDEFAYGGIYNVDFVNRGAVNFNQGDFFFESPVLFGDVFEQTAGTFNLAGGTAAAYGGEGTQGTLYFSGGSITGTGDIFAETCVGSLDAQCNPAIGGVLVSPGNSLGTLNFNGDLTLSPDSVIAIELGGQPPASIQTPLDHTQTNADVVNVFGTLTRNNAGIEVSLTNGFEPEAGQEFPVLYIDSGNTIDDEAAAEEFNRQVGAGEIPIDPVEGLDVALRAETISSYAVIVDVASYTPPQGPTPPPGPTPPGPPAPPPTGQQPPPPPGPGEPPIPPGDPINDVVSDIENNPPPGLFDPGVDEGDEEDRRKIGLCTG